MINLSEIPRLFPEERKKERPELVVVERLPSDDMPTAPTKQSPVEEPEEEHPLPKKAGLLDNLETGDDAVLAYTSDGRPLRTKAEFEIYVDDVQFREQKLWKDKHKLLRFAHGLSQKYGLPLDELMTGVSSESEILDRAFNLAGGVKSENQEYQDLLDSGALQVSYGGGAPAPVRSKAKRLQEQKAEARYGGKRAETARLNYLKGDLKK